MYIFYIPVTLVLCRSCSHCDIQNN